MLNKDLITASIPALSLTDPVYQAIQLMDDFNVSHLPVISEDKYIGLVSENDLLNVDNDTILLENIQAEFSTISVNANFHFLESARRRRYITSC